MNAFAEEIRIGRDAMRYGFAVGKVRVLETRTLDAPAFERLLDAPSFTEQKRLLSETVYGRYIEQAHSAEEVERCLEEALADFYRLLEEAALPPAVSRFFRVRYDYANLKAAAKSRALGAPIEGLLVEHGTVPAEAFRGDLTALPAPLSRVARELAAPDAQIDLTVDRAMFAEFVRLCEESGSAFLCRMAGLFVDIANLKTLVRSRKAGLSVERTRELFVEGGSVSTGVFERLAVVPEAELAEAIVRTPGFKDLGAEHLLDAARLDLTTDELLIAAMRHARRGPIGPEPVIAYVLGREVEVAALRVLLLGKLGGIDDDTVRARLRATYR